MTGETVRVIRKPKVDRLKPASGPTVEFDIPGCDVIPRASQEAGRGWVQISGYTIIKRKKAVDVRADDTILVRGELHSVIGKPGVFKRGLRTKAVVITTERV